MTQAQHTPGPWHRNIKPATKYSTIFAGRNTHVAHLATAGLAADEVEANCNLIAAAPDLDLAVVRLIDAAEDYLSSGSDSDKKYLLEKIENGYTAIDKARGK